MRAPSMALLAVMMAVGPTAAQETHEYDPAAEVTLTGVVRDYHESKARNDHPGLHFVLEIPTGAEGAPVDEGAPPPADPANETPGIEPPQAGGDDVIEEVPVQVAATVEVHACPVRLLSQLDFPIEKGDEVTVTGSRPGNGPILIAREIKKGVVSLTLRDEEGEPIWAGLP